MDQNLQLLQVAQDTIQGLCNFLSMPVPPTRAQVQGLLDSAKARIAIIHAQMQAAGPPLVVPQLVPPTPAPTPETPK
jgi:hypothetical protein